MCSRLTDDDYYEDDEEDDPDALKDPIYQIDLQVPFFLVPSLISNVSISQVTAGLMSQETVLQLEDLS